jgi:hypothetical protein
MSSIVSITAVNVAKECEFLQKLYQNALRGVFCVFAILLGNRLR